MASQQATQHQELDKLVECYLHDPIHRKIAIDPTFMHRINIVNAWRIPTSAKRLLDIGCGQGESSLTLANAFPDAHVTGIDSASPDYGAPITLGQSQAYILGSPLGNRITFETADLISYLLNGAGAAAGSFDTALFCHSLWYWSSVEQIRELFAALAKSNVSRICIAEWSGTASSPDQEPHVLAAKVQKELFALRPASGASSLHEQNIRTGLSPDELFELAAEAAGWRVAKRGIVKPPSDLREGVWETDYVKSDDFRKTVEVASERLDDEKKAELLGYQDLVRDAVEKCGGRNQVKCMDVVWAVLERDAITA